MKKMKRQVVSLVAALALTFGLCACGDKKSETTTEATTQVTTEATTEVATDDASETTELTDETVYPLEIENSDGTVITIENEPEKIVSVAPNLTELVYKLGADDKLVGRSDYCDYPSEVLDVESVGDIMTPDIEKIISLEPDVVLASTHFDADNEAKLTELGITVVALFEESDVEGVYSMIDKLGEILNKNTEAAACVDEMKNTIADVEAKVSGLEKPSVYYVVGYGEYGDYTAGGDTFIGKMLSMAGGENIAKDISGWTITLEELVEADPSIIVISEYMKPDFMSLPNYADLTAVKEDKVFTLDTNMLDRQGYRNAEGILELAKIFHPEAFE